jgi:hypothetical protein
LGFLQEVLLGPNRKEDEKVKIKEKIFEIKEKRWEGVILFNLFVETIQ